MKIVQTGQTLSVSEIDELGASNSSRFMAALGAAMLRGPAEIEVDLSNTGFFDCTGMGALVALRNRARHINSKATLRLVNPAKRICRVLELTRLDKVFPVETR